MMERDEGDSWHTCVFLMSAELRAIQAYVTNEQNNLRSETALWFSERAGKYEHSTLFETE